MKTAYELAMERLSKSDPTVKLSTAQKGRIAALESRYKAKIAEREIAMEGELRQAAGEGDTKKVQAIQARLAQERQSLQAELETKKEAARKASGRS